MVQTPAKPLTLEEFLAMPETKPASEYINGKIIQKPMPKGKHSTIHTELSTALNVVLKSQKIARAFSELRCTFGERSTVPDVAVFTWERIPRDDDGAIVYPLGLILFKLHQIGQSKSYLPSGDTSSRIRFGRRALIRVTPG
jgi:Uma2 family endonuclease